MAPKIPENKEPVSSVVDTATIEDKCNLTADLMYQFALDRDNGIHSSVALDVVLKSDMTEEEKNAWIKVVTGIYANPGFSPATIRSAMLSQC